MKKITTTLLLLLVITHNSICQDHEAIYLNDEFQEVKKEEATYYSISKPQPDDTSKLFVQTYYLSGQIKSKTTCRSQLCWEKEGHYVSFHENGEKEEEGERINNAKSGVWDIWYDNGQKKETAVYFMGSISGSWKSWYKDGQQKKEGEVVVDRNSELYLRNKIINYWNKRGEQLIVDGDGEVEYYYEDTLVIESKGQYQNGFKNGVWKGYTKGNQLRYEETYNENEVSGISWDEEGNEYKYINLEDDPQPNGGMRGFYKYVGRTIMYPGEARQLGTQGKVYVQFFISKSGEITEVEIIKGIGRGCDEEAVRVLKNSPLWNPGKRRGQPVEVRMILPINFKLG